MNKDFIRNIVYGFAIGDALGVPFEFQNSEFCKKYYKDKYTNGTHNQLPGTWSDDTSILLCVLDSGGDVEKYKQNLKDWYYQKTDKFGLRFDVGGGTKKAIESNFTYNTNKNLGNGCLVVTLGCWLLGIENDLVFDYINLTHNAEKCWIYCFTTYITQLGLIMLYNKSLFFLEELIYDNNGKCDTSINISIKSFNEGDSFKKCINNAIIFGGDTDSHAAFTGSMAGIQYKIPKYYISNLKGKEKINNIINRL